MNPQRLLRAALIGVVIFSLDFRVSALPGGTFFNQFFGDHTNFTASRVTQLFDGTGNLKSETTERIAILDGKERIERTAQEFFEPSPRGIQIQWKDGRVQSCGSTGAWAGTDTNADREITLGMASFGVFGRELLEAGGKLADKPIGSKMMKFYTGYEIGRPDKQLFYFVFPSINGYVDKPAPDWKPLSNITTEALPSETLDGHPCQKNLWTCVSKEGRKLKYQVWSAVDLGNFPIQIKLSVPYAEIVEQLKDVQLAKPDSKLFELPDNCVRYGDLKQALKQIAGNSEHSP